MKQLLKLPFLAILVSTLILSGCVPNTVKPVSRSLSTTSWGYKVVSAPEPVYLGKKSQRFEVRPGDCAGNPDWSDCATDRERSEVTSKSAIFRPGGEYWISYLLYLPTDFETSPSVNATLGQIHIRGGFKGKAGGYKSFPPLLQLEARGSAYTACFHTLQGSADNIRDVCMNSRLALIDDMKGKWSRITINLKGTPKEPVVDLYFNGAKAVTFNQLQPFPRAPKEYYLKYGIYRSFVSKHNGPMPTQIAYYDEVKVGRTRAEVEDETLIID